MSTVYVEIDGQPKPISECSWVQVAPCGCTCAWLDAGGYEGRSGPHEPLVTEQQLVDHFDIPKWQQKEEREQGYTYNLIDRPTAINDLKSSSDGCPHTPKWGVPPRAAMDGYEWAFKRGSRTFHLVLSEAVRRFGESVEDRMKRPRDVESLCGVAAYGWDDTQFEEKPDCKKCSKIARDRMPAAVAS